MGYLVHCLSDRLVLPHFFHNAFPFSLLKKRISKSNYPVILEFLNIELVKDSNLNLSMENNSLLRELGVEDENVSKFIRQIGDYINSPSIQSSLDLYKNLGSAKASQTSKYEKYIKLWEKIRFLKYVIPVNISMRKINEGISAEIRKQVSGLFEDKSIEDNSYKYLG